MRKFLLTIFVLTLIAWGCSTNKSESYQKPLNAASDPWQETFEPAEYHLLASHGKFSGPRSDPSGEQKFRSRKLPFTRVIDLQANHENGAQVQLKEITFDSTRTSLEAVIVNGSDASIELNSFGKELVLVDSLKNIYRLVAPTHNEKLKIKAGETVRMSLSFSGRFHPDAESVTLVTNDQTGDLKGRDSTKPKFLLEIPLDGII